MPARYVEAAVRFPVANVPREIRKVVVDSFGVRVKSGLFVNRQPTPKGDAVSVLSI